MWVVFCCCVRRGTYVKNRDGVGPTSKTLREDTETRGEAGGAARSDHLNCSAVSFQRSSAVDTLWSSQWGGELEKEEDGGREIYKQRGMFQEEEEEERGRIFREGKVRSEWAYMGGFHCWRSLFFSSVWATAPSSLRNRWHNAEEADWSFKLGGSQRKAEFELTLHPSRHQKLYFLLHW